MSHFQSFLLGFVQGISEFLPISSSAHLILVPWFFGWSDPGLTYDVFLHGGTLLAILIYFFKDWMSLVSAGIQSVFERKIGFIESRRLFWKIIIATIPAGLAGLLFHDLFDSMRAPLIIAVTLSCVGFIIYWVDGHYTSLRKTEELSFLESLWVGVAQIAALVPGVSRSGSTMAMGRALGVSRDEAARFSFLISFPITLAAFALEFKNAFLSGVPVSMDLGVMLTGFVSSFITGIVSIHFLLQYLKKSDFRVFVWYRVILAVSVVIFSLVLSK